MLQHLLIFLQAISYYSNPTYDVGNMYISQSLGEHPELYGRVEPTNSEGR